MEKVNQKQNAVLCILQARMGSTRLPGKVLLKVRGTPLLEYEIMRVKFSKTIDKIVIATTTNKEDDEIEKLARRIGIDCFRGSEKDVLDRYYQCALLYPKFSSIVRITGDCPLIDPGVIDEVVSLFQKGHFDYVSNIELGKETFPNGTDVEVLTREALVELAANASLASEREHVTLYIRRRKEKFKTTNVNAVRDFSHIRFTVDYLEDFEVVKFLIEHSAIDATYLQHVSLLMDNPNIMAKNMHIVRNEGLKKLSEENRLRPPSSRSDA
ncbi:MAG: glycosyltransferase family protein [Candidatus Wildermuthbacteria bacterium]|nr:glycosyltransferase family protein [Candidatus Wildermuthbacteria bacterium]